MPSISACFNPRARAGRDVQYNLHEVLTPFQSTRPRGARLTGEHVDVCEYVSIHAPARGATVGSVPTTPLASFNPRARAGRDDEVLKKYFQTTVSIHAPARGATSRLLVERSARSFNPRARAGRDLSQSQSQSQETVSIHAPARGATIASVNLLDHFCFNPRARAGRDGHSRKSRLAAAFQSTRPRGARQTILK